jgi:SAM-dependent methyltransferase|tara:strand:- start:116 stop:817 length:702 start_codon:yes stop_codon:yes gene_type:complete
MNLKKIKHLIIQIMENSEFLQQYARKKAEKNQGNFLSRKRTELHERWQNISDGSLESYIKGRNGESFLLTQIKSLSVIFDDDILEIGCNVGRNLNHLYVNGYHKLHGIEINQKAINKMSETFPSVHNSSNIIQGSVEEKIKQFKDNEIKLTFTMAVLQHIHPESNFIFKEMSRITSKYIIIMERETHTHIFDEFSRNYKKIFEELGWMELRGESLDHLFPNRLGYHFRLFEKQ